MRYTALVFTFMAVLTTFGIATTSFVAVLGALGIAIGLALQGTLSNLAAGIMLVVFRPFHIGDRIETANVGGTAREINLFFTEIDGDDNARVIIPNGKLWGEIVRVPTRNDTTRIDLPFQRPPMTMSAPPSARLKESDRARQARPEGRRHRRRERRRPTTTRWLPISGCPARVSDRATLRSQPQHQGRVRAPAAGGSGAPRRIGLASPMDTALGLPVEISEWKPGAVRLEAARRCSPSATSMAARLNCEALLGCDRPPRRGRRAASRRLIYLGDMINRGPDSVGVLQLWAEGEDVHGVDHVDRLMGNHEIMMLLTVIGGPHAHKAETMWLGKRMGGRSLLDVDARGRAGHARPARPTRRCSTARWASRVVHRLQGMRTHVRLGNTVFVHGGLDPHADPDEFLDPALDHVHRGALGLDQPRLPRLEGGASAARWWCMAIRRPTSTAPSAAWKIRISSAIRN